MPDIGDNAIFSTTDDNNNSATNPGFPNGMARDRLNNASRAFMGSVKREWETKNGVVTATLSGSNYSATYTGGPTAYYDGQIFRLHVNSANPGPCSLNINGLGARTVKIGVDNVLGRDLLKGEIGPGHVWEFVYNSTFSTFVVTPAYKWSGLIKQTSSTVYTTTSNVASTELVVPLQPISEVRVRGSVSVEAGATGIGVGVQWPSNAAGDFLTASGSAVFTGGSVQGLGVITAVGTTSADIFSVSFSGRGLISIDAHIKSSNSGNFALTFKKSTAGASNLTVLAGSYLQVTKA
jgi:hypothetical protein